MRRPRGSGLDGAEEELMPSQGYVAVVGVDFSDMSNKAVDQAIADPQ